MKHKPVLLNEVLNFLNPQKNGVYFDGTFGGGGHATKILEKTHFQSQVIGVDLDADNLNRYQKSSEGSSSSGTLAEVLDSSELSKKSLVLFHENYKNIKKILEKLHIQKVDGILLDVGCSSFQLDESTRGFSFLRNGPLDMRMDKSENLTAEELVNTLSEKELVRIFFEYGEERMARRIAHEIIKERPLKTTFELVEIIKRIKGEPHPGHKHPATQVFQALRIAVNGELESLKQALEDGVDVLKVGGRFCVISFHSLEDRLVKQNFAYGAKACVCPSDFPVCRCNKKQTLKILTKKPLVPKEHEINENIRARSAKLRVAERI